MRMGRTLGLALAGSGLLAAAPSVARADDDPSLQDRLRQLEQQVLVLKDQMDRRAPEPEPLSDQVDRYLQEQEKGVLWVDRNNKPLGKAVDSVWVTAWLRGRPTWSDNTFDMNDDVDDEGTATFFRGGLGVGAHLKGKVSMFIGLDFAGTWGNTATLYTNDTPTATTVQEAYIDGLYSKHLNMDTRIGRFEMQYGDEYVIGRTEFAQASTYFDGVRVGRNAEGAGFTWDLFAVKLVDGFKNPLTPTPDDSAYMAGFYGNWYAFEGKTRVPGGLEPYYIVVKDGQEAPATAARPPRDVHTAGIHWYGDRSTKDRSGIGWNVNANAQHNFGWQWSTDSRLYYTNPNMKGKPMVFGQFAYASGDVDGVTGYNPLWQDGHGRFGWADQFAFTNLALAGVGMHFQAREGLTVGLEGRSIHQARSTRTSPSRQLAWEGDLVVKHKYSDNVAVEFAYSYVYWRDARNATGASADDSQRAYLQVVVSF